MEPSARRASTAAVPCLLLLAGSEHSASAHSGAHKCTAFLTSKHCKRPTAPAAVTAASRSSSPRTNEQCIYTTLLDWQQQSGCTLLTCDARSIGSSVQGNKVAASRSVRPTQMAAQSSAKLQADAMDREVDYVPIHTQIPSQELHTEPSYRSDLRRNGYHGCTGAPDTPQSRKDLRVALDAGDCPAAVAILEALVYEGTMVEGGLFHQIVSRCMYLGQWRPGLQALYIYLENGKRWQQPLAPETLRVGLRALNKAGQVDAVVGVVRAALENGGAGVDEKLCSMALDACATTGRMNLAEQLVDLMGQHAIPQGPVTYCILVKGYGRQKRVRMVDRVLAVMKERHVRPDVVALNAAIDAYVRCGDLKKARVVLRLMEMNATLAPDTRSYNTLIKGFGRQGRLDEAFEVLKSMAEHGCVPNEVTVNTLVDSCVKCGDLERAYILLKQGVNKPSVESYTSVLTGFAYMGDKDSALAVFRQMTRAGVQPNLITYTALITACVNADAMDDARRLFRALEYRGASDPNFVPSVVTYNCLISGLCHQRCATRPADAAAAEEADLTPSADAGPVEEATPAAPPDAPAPGSGGVETMGSPAPAPVLLRAAQVDIRGVMQELAAQVDVEVPDGELWQGSLPEGLQESLQLLSSMWQRGVRPNDITMNSLLDGLASCSTSRMREAEMLLSWFSALGVRPTQVTYSIMLKGYGRAGHLDAAQQMFDTITNDLDTCPDVVALNCFLDACVKNDDLKRAVSTLEEVCLRSHAAERPRRGSSQAEGAVLEGVLPNLVTFSTVILGLSRSLNMFAGQKAMALYQQMRTRHRLEPDEVLVNGLLQACCNSRTRRGGLSLEDGHTVLRDLETLGWDTEVILEKEKLLQAVVPALSEVWKEGGASSGQAEKKPKKSEQIFQKYGWNTINSGFPFL